MLLFILFKKKKNPGRSGTLEKLHEHLLEIKLSVWLIKTNQLWFPGGTILLNSDVQNTEVLCFLSPISNYIMEFKCEVQSLSLRSS